MPKIQLLSTERLVLRPWRPDDLDEYALMCSDPEVMRYLGNGQVLNRAEAWRQIALFVGHWALRGYGLWALENMSDGSFIGRAGLWCPEGWPGLEVGWALKRAAWGHGFATEASRAAVEFAWEVVGADEVISLIHPSNDASRRVAERLGLRCERRQKLGGSDVLVYRRSRPTE